MTIQNCDARDGIRQLPDESVDLILTDPPYVKEQWESAYTLLAEEGSRVLKKSGYLITYCGQFYLNKIMRIMDDYLSYYWVISQINTGAKCLVHSRNIIASFKPVLVYQKPPFLTKNRVTLDIIKNGKRSKTFHAWQQDIHEALHLMRIFSNPGDMVLDPFVGSGTVAVAAKALGRNFVGFEIDPGTYEVAMGRLAQEPITIEAF